MLTDQEIERLRNDRDEIKNEVEAVEREMAAIERECEDALEDNPNLHAASKMAMRRLNELDHRLSWLRDSLNAIYDRLPLEMYDED